MTLKEFAKKTNCINLEIAIENMTNEYNYGMAKGVIFAFYSQNLISDDEAKILVNELTDLYIENRYK